MECPKCGKSNKLDATICSNCYFDLQSNKTPVKSNVTVKPRQASPLPTQTPPSQQSAQQPYAAPPQPGGYAPPPPDPHQAPFQGPAAFAYMPTMDYAGFWQRVGAVFIDSIIFAAIGAMVNAVIGIPHVSTTPTVPGASPNSTNAIMNKLAASRAQKIITLIENVYVIGLNTACGATVGKMAMGIQIVKVDGSPVGFGTVLLRYILECILGVCTLGITFIVAAFSKKKQTLHDMIVGTVVIRTR